MRLSAKKIYYAIKTQIYYRLFFKKIGMLSIIIKPLKVVNRKNILIGGKIVINDFSWLQAEKKGSILILDNTRIGHFSHIIAYKEVIIGKNVLIADKVFITDCSHSYHKIDMPILNQELKLLKPVKISEGSWIGENVSIIGASIGKNSIVGANSVVTKDIPDYSVAAGNPAVIIKTYDMEKKEWIKVY
ncbi:MAG: acyltransferase [Acholeplasma sp.]|nr:acyltransferase [Acholeplasma sp.]